MQLRQRVIRHHREHVVLDMVVHVPVDEAADRVHQHGARVEPVIDDVVGEPAMLQQPGHHVMPGAVEARQPDQHQRQQRSHGDGERDRRDIDRRPDPRDADRLGSLHLGNEGFFLGADVAHRVADHVAHGAPRVEDAEEIEHDARQVRRPHDGDFRIKPDDDRIGMMARMAPAPGDGIAHDHEAGELVDRVVHPACLEGGAVTAFVPALNP